MNFAERKTKAKRELFELLKYMKSNVSNMKKAKHSKQKKSKSSDQELLEAIESGKGLKEDFNIDVVYGYAYSIKKYYMESGNPRQMRGASQNLKKIFDELIPEHLGKKYRRECAYCKGGSQILVIVPSGAGKKIVDVIEDYFNQYAPTANNAAVMISCKANDLLIKDRFIVLKAKLKQMGLQRRMLKYDNNLLNMEGSELDISKHKYLRKYENNQKQVIDNQETEVCCERCRLRTGRYITEIDGDNVIICSSCAHKEIGGDYNARNSFKKQCKQYGEKCNPKVEMHESKEIRKTEDIQDINGNIALLYADVNNLGGAGRHIEGILNEKIFFEAVEETVEEALYNSLINAMKQLDKQQQKKVINHKLESRFEIVAVGGDDICLILPGQIALYTASLLVREFERKWNAHYYEGFKKSMGSSAKLSISAGISIASYHTPLTYMQMATEHLLKSAKDLSHKRAKQDGDQDLGAVDILSLNSDGQWAMQLDLLRKPKDKQVYMTMRPFSINEAETFLSALKGVRDLPNHMLRNIDAACKEMNKEESMLYFNYMLSKIEKNDSKYMNLQHLFEQLYSMKGITDKGKPEMFLKTSEGYYIAPWHDILDLYDQIGGA